MLSAMNNLAVLYKNERNYGQAVSLLTRVLEIQRRVLGRGASRTC